MKRNRNPGTDLPEASFADRDWGRAVRASGAMVMAAAALVAANAKPASANSATSGNRVTAIANRGDRVLSSAEKPPKLQIFPTGVRPSDTLYTDSPFGSEVSADIQLSEQEHKFQWTGLIKISIPTKKPGQVSLSQAPRSYNDLPDGRRIFGYDPKSKTPREKQIYLFRPLLYLHKIGKQERLFAQVMDFDNHMTQLSVDVGLLTELGAGSAYKCDNENPRLIDLNQPQPAGTVVLPSFAEAFPIDRLTTGDEIKVFADSVKKTYYCTPLGDDALSKLRVP